MFRTSEQTDKLDAALAKAQSQIDSASKDKVNPAFKSKYADLTAVWEACRAALTGNGISVSQWPVHSDDSRLHLITRLACQGQWMMCEFSIPADKQNAHGYGSAITYAKRFSLAAAIGVVADEDDDGNAASRPRNVAPDVGAPPKSKDPIAPWRGPLTKTELQKRVRALVSDINACDDTDQLESCLESYKLTIDQCRTDMPDWWSGEAHDGFVPLEDRIKGRRDVLKNLEFKEAS